MSRMMIGTFFVLAYFLTAVSSCSANKTSKKESAFQILVPIQGMNINLNLKSMELPEFLKNGYDFDLVIKNVSKDAVWLPGDYGIKLLLYNEAEAKWVDVQQKMEVVLGDDNIIEPKGKDTPNFRVATISPDLPQGDQLVSIRVVVLGKVYRDGQKTDEDVGAWIDVTLPVSK